MATRTRRTNTTEATSPARRSPSNGDDAKGTDTATSRRMRKRELDRRCQRIARERTKNRISYLEGLVEDFRKQDSTGQVATLMKQLSDMQKDRDTLAKTLQSIQNSIQTHQNSLKGTSQGSIPNLSGTDEPRGGTSNRIETLDDGDGSPGSEPIHKVEEVDDEVQFLHAIERPNRALIDPRPSFRPDLSPEEAFIQTPTNGFIDDPIIPRADEECECCSTSATSSYGSAVNMWRFANEVLTQPTEVSRDINDFEDAIADDTPIRALLEGWEAVANRYGGKLPPSWQKLRKIDEVIFGRCNNRERLAIMRVMHHLMRFHTDRTQEKKAKVPAWYLQRPSQTMAHSYAIDYFAWPGLRERFVFYQHRYCGNVFWHLFCNSLRISWPYEFRDCYTRNLETGEYQISASFDARVSDINAWTMRPDIFKRWPEFYSDFPRDPDYIPMHIALSMPTQRRTVASSTRLIEAGNRRRRSSNSIHPASNAMYPASNAMHPTSNPMQPTANVMHPTTNSMHPTSSSMHPRSSISDHSTIDSEESRTEDNLPMAFWNPLDVVMDSSYSQLPAKGLVDLLGQSHYSDFNGRNDFVF